MKLIDFKANNGLPGFCWAAYDPEIALVIVSEDAGNTGPSVTNAASEIADAVCDLYDILEANLILIEHYGPGSYTSAAARGEEDRFARCEFKGTGFFGPQWRYVPATDPLYDYCKEMIDQ